MASKPTSSQPAPPAQSSRAPADMEIPRDQVRVSGGGGERRCWWWWRASVLVVVVSGGGGERRQHSNSLVWCGRLPCAVCRVRGCARDRRGGGNGSCCHGHVC